MRERVIREILNHKAIAIVRGIYGQECLQLAQAMYTGGIRLLEVTFDQRSEAERQRTVDTLRLLTEKLGGVMCFGAGTVTTPEMVAQAKAAGAAFIVSPDTCREVIEATVAAGMVSIPGALTPTEVAQAHRFGADFVKLFPANQMGPAYFKAICAPLSHVRLLAVGGVDNDTITAYLDAGAVGAGVAGCLFKKAWVEAGEWQKITDATAAFVAKLER